MRFTTLLLACLIGAVGVASVLSLADQARLGVEAEARRTQSGAARPEGTTIGSPGVTVYTDTVRLPTYPYAGCLGAPQTGAANVPYRRLDWACLAAAGPPLSQTYTRLVLANAYLSVTLLPELGGRVYEMIFKPTGHNLLYRNPVVKPAPFGPPEQGWWLAVGGLEWGFPTDEHGYEWGSPWLYQVLTSSASVTVALRDSAALMRPTMGVNVTLAADRAALVVRPEVVNPTLSPVGVKVWINGLLAPGGGNRPSADFRFLFPTDRVTVHSTGDPRLPPAGQVIDWPIYGGRDLSRLGNWDQWLGFFEAPQAHGPFAGVYDAVADEGVLRIIPADVARGSKGFAFGWSDPLPSSLWTDDGSAYVEVHGGLAPTFWDTVVLSPGQRISWTEQWLPLAGLGGVSSANEQAAMRMEREGETLELGVVTTAAQEDGELILTGRDCNLLGRWRIPRVAPDRPFTRSLGAAGLPTVGLGLAAVSSSSKLLGGVAARDCLPPAAAITPLPFYVTTSTFSVAWRGSDVWSGVVDYDVQVRAGYRASFVDWLTHTKALSDTFEGAPGETYFFRARARDNAGNTGAFGDDEWGQAFTSVLLTPAPVLITSRKVGSPLTATIDQPVTHIVTISNTGNLTAYHLQMTDRLPIGLLPLDGPGAAGVITWHGALPPGEEVRLRYGLAIAEAPQARRLTNTVRLVAEGVPPLTRQAVIRFHYPLYLPLIQSGP